MLSRTPEATRGRDIARPPMRPRRRTAVVLELLGWIKTSVSKRRNRASGAAGAQRKAHSATRATCRAGGVGSEMVATRATESDWAYRHAHLSMNMEPNGCLEAPGTSWASSPGEAVSKTSEGLPPHSQTLGPSWCQGKHGDDRVRSEYGIYT